MELKLFTVSHLSIASCCYTCYIKGQPPTVLLWAWDFKKVCFSNVVFCQIIYTLQHPKKVFTLSYSSNIDFSRTLFDKKLSCLLLFLLLHVSNKKDELRKWIRAASNSTKILYLPACKKAWHTCLKKYWIRPSLKKRNNAGPYSLPFLLQPQTRWYHLTKITYNFAVTKLFVLQWTGPPFIFFLSHAIGVLQFSCTRACAIFLKRKCQ